MGTVTVCCVDHHVSPGTLPPGPRYMDHTAAATGELVCEIALANDWAVPPLAARALYVAILTDTGGFDPGQNLAEVSPPRDCPELVGVERVERDVDAPYTMAGELAGIASEHRAIGRDGQLVQRAAHEMP